MFYKIVLPERSEKKEKKIELKKKPKMSNVLDQIIMEDVAKNCPREFMEYHKCIAANHEDPTPCSYRQVDLSKCIKAKVPSVQKVLRNCSEKMQKYEQCVKDHMETKTINENCLGLLKEMRACAEKQMGAQMPINEM